MSGRPRVLLADDHPGVVKALGRLLSFECDVVGEISDGSEVADAAAALQPVVVVLDVNLPTVNGLEACRQITSNTPHARVIVISAMTDEAITRAAELAGAAHFFNKGAMGDELVLAIKQAWEQVR